MRHMWHISILMHSTTFVKCHIYHNGNINVKIINFINLPSAERVQIGDSVVLLLSSATPTQCLVNAVRMPGKCPI